MIAGIRHDSYRYDKSFDKSSTNPRFSLSYMPFAGSAHDYTTLWASYSEAFNPPEAWHSLGNAFLKPNPDIKPEKTKGYEVGIKQRIGYFANVEMSYFDTDYSDMIAISFQGGKPFFTNINQASLKGIEGKLEVYPTDWLSLYLGYTKLDRKDKTTNQAIKGKPNQILQYGISVNDLAGFYGHLQGLHYRDYKNDASKAKMGIYHPSNNQILWNLKILYRYDFSNRLRIEPFIAVNNLTDKEYYEGQPIALVEGRSYQAGASLRMEF